MVLLKRLNPFATSSPSIAKSEEVSQTSQLRIEAPMSNFYFLPSLNDKQTFRLWISYISFFSLISIVTQLTLTTDTHVIIRYIIETLVMTIVIVSGEMIFVAESAKKFNELNWRAKQISHYLLSRSLVIVPVLTLFGRFMLFLTFDYQISMIQLIIEIIANTIFTCLMIVILMTYFEIQYQNIRRVEQRTQQKLIEQNEQLKARITPHFFFNLLNTMQYLIETDTQEAEVMIRHISNLYRVSFDETREIALLDEIELCESYLSIEKYRFDKKLNVTWQLPDEEILYDMVITSLSLQMVIEKLIVQIVENTTEAIELVIAIDWQHDMVKIDIKIELPLSSYQVISRDIRQKLSFKSQVAILRQFYGETATIDYQLAEQLLITHIRYPLKDVAVF